MEKFYFFLPNWNVYFLMPWPTNFLCIIIKLRMFATNIPIRHQLETIKMENYKPFNQDYTMLQHKSHPKSFKLRLYNATTTNIQFKLLITILKLVKLTNISKNHSSKPTLSHHSNKNRKISPFRLFSSNTCTNSQQRLVFPHSIRLSAPKTLNNMRIVFPLLSLQLSHIDSISKGSILILFLLWLPTKY